MPSDRERQHQMQALFDAAYEAETHLETVIVPALVAAIGEGETAVLLRRIADELDGE